MAKTIVFASEAPAATLSERVRRGELVRLAPGVYTTDVTSDPAAVTAREWPAIAGGLVYFGAFDGNFYAGAIAGERQSLLGKRPAAATANTITADPNAMPSAGYLTLGGARPSPWSSPR